jgi:glutamate racemase
MKNAIGSFDSGLGGLTVLKVLAQEFPEESFHYLGDIARLPYGNKSPETIRRYGEQILRFLKTQNVKALIIACNSASTVFLGEDTFEGTPLLNVIEPGALAAVKIATDNKIGVLGTSATIRSKAYSKTILELNSLIEVTEQACPLFVPLVEEGLQGDPITNLAVKKYVKELQAQKVKTVILGCTHYPMIKNDLAEVLGSDVTLIESGSVLASKVTDLFDRKVLVRSSGKRELKISITDITDQFEHLARKLMHPEMLGELEKVVL